MVKTINEEQTFMNMFILLTIFTMLFLNAAYEFTCPSQAHWNIRAKSMCDPPRNYTCLFNVTFRVNVYRERCRRPRLLAPGHKYVFQPDLNKATCSETRYQPFNFDTIGYSDCAYQKSLCNSLGQEVYTRTSTNTTVNRKCICNTDGGYGFVRNSQNQCYCNPSTEDCSCYQVINPYNKTGGLKGIKCYEEKTMWRGNHKKDILNVSTITIFEFDHYKYNLNYVRRNEYRIEAVKWILIFSFTYSVVCIILLINWRRLRKCIQYCSGLPGPITYLSEEDRIRYNELMRTEKTEKRYFVRTMIVGKESVGKTCLMRRLLKEDISDVSSTDGVDIVVRRVKINIEDGKWIIGKEIDDDKADRIKRALTTNADDRDIHSMQIDETKTIYESPSGGMFTLKNDTTTNTEVSLEINQPSSEDLTTDAEVFHEKNEEKNECSSLVMHVDSANDANVNLSNHKESLSLVMPDDLMSHVFSKSTLNTTSDRYALCELWDFAGQKEFYATHQAFLTSSAVYLVVTDMEDDISKQGLSHCFADYQHIGEYVDFWFDSIHCHRTADERSRYGHFDPPILLVFTGKDKYDKQADFKKREKELDKQIDGVFGLQGKYHHLHHKFYLSNTKDTDEEFEKLRIAISKCARKMDNWGNAFPLKWILLEHLIDINKINRTNFINFTDFSNLAKHPDINMLERKDLMLFLRFQHNIGNIIFFENIQDLIILRPQWLADAFRCLVSDKIDNSRLHHLDDWTLLTRQGKISESLITELFNSKDESQFSGQKNNLHKVMEKLDILVKIENSNYIMPSMMPSAKFEDVCEQFGILTDKCIRTSWLCFKFEFLPPSFFNHLSAWFIRNYDPSKLESGIALYRGICMFDIEGSGCKKILVTMSSDTIALQVVTFSKKHETFGSTCSDVYREVRQLIEDIKKRYRIKISFKLHFKCSDGYYFQDTFEYKKLTTEECFCIQHKQTHQSFEIYSPWMNNEVEKSHNRANISTKQDDHNPKNVTTTGNLVQRPLSVDLRKQVRIIHPSSNTHQNNLPVSATLRKHVDITPIEKTFQNIKDCIKIGNMLLFTEDYKNQLIVYNEDGAFERTFRLDYKPRYLTEINKNTVAVSCPRDRTVLLLKIKTGSVGDRIITKDKCYGISYNMYNEFLYVVVGFESLSVMNLAGKVMRIVDLFHTCHITVHRDMLVCIDNTLISCLSLHGEFIWKFQDDKYRRLRRVTTDDEGNVYVTNEDTNVVLVVSKDGKQQKEILTESNGMKMPAGIHFDKKENILMICSDRDAWLFDVITNKK